MLFNSLQFLIFLPIAFAFYWGFRGHRRMQNVILVLLSSYYYCCWEWRAYLLLVLIVVSAYVCGLRKWRVVGIVLPLLVLAVFKYANFFLGGVVGTLDLLLPVGLSFYTFMAVSYVIDVSRGTITAERNLLTFASYLMFFPQLAAGPIGRGGEMLPQFRENRKFDYVLAVDGCRQFLWGFAKKVLIADACARVVDGVYAAYSLQKGSMILLAMILYTVQIYADFSAYSDMAIGVGKLFGIRLRKNFVYPYFASNISDFWRRWHMSLTTWFRDYVYFPLGGSRVPFARIILNTWIVFVLSGLWHGAAWTYVIWGAVHAAFISVYIAWKRWGVELPRFTGCLLTMLCVIVAWVFFRAPSIESAVGILGAACSSSLFAVPALGKKMLVALGVSVALLVWEFAARRREYALSLLPPYRWARWSVYVALIFAIMLSFQNEAEFIYFQY